MFLKETTKCLRGKNQTLEGIVPMIQVLLLLVQKNSTNLSSFLLQWIIINFRDQALLWKSVLVTLENQQVGN